MKLFRIFASFSKAEKGVLRQFAAYALGMSQYSSLNLISLFW
jgi:hypothetical protein